MCDGRSWAARVLSRDIAVLGHVAPVAVRAGAVDDKEEEREESAAEDRRLHYLFINLLEEAHR